MLRRDRKECLITKRVKEASNNQLTWIFWVEDVPPYVGRVIEQGRKGSNVLSVSSFKFGNCVNRCTKYIGKVLKYSISGLYLCNCLGNREIQHLALIY